MTSYRSNRRNFDSRQNGRNDRYGRTDRYDRNDRYQRDNRSPVRRRSFDRPYRSNFRAEEPKRRDYIAESAMAPVNRETVMNK